MGILGGLIAKLMDTIPEEQKSGAENMVAGIAEGAAGLAVAKAITPEIASLAGEAVKGLSIPPLANAEGVSHNVSPSAVAKSGQEIA